MRSWKALLKRVEQESTTVKKMVDGREETYVLGVPAVWESVKKGVIGKVNKLNPTARNLFWAVLAAKTFLPPYLASVGLEAGAMNIIFKRVREATGGHPRITTNGGGHSSRETQDFLSLTVAPMIQGYGLTKTAATGVFTDPLL